MGKRKNSGGLVYSTDQGRMCPGCVRPVAECVCRDTARGSTHRTARNKPERVRIERQTRGRKGAGVTVVTGLARDADELRRIARALKARCGVGGTLKAGVIELQGDQRDTVLAWLTAEGISAKKAGG